MKNFIFGRKSFTFIVLLLVLMVMKRSNMIIKAVKISYQRQEEKHGIAFKYLHMKLRNKIQPFANKVIIN